MVLKSMKWRNWPSKFGFMIGLITNWAIGPEISKFHHLGFKFRSKTFTVHLKHIIIMNLWFCKNPKIKISHPPYLFSALSPFGSCTEVSHFDTMGHIWLYILPAKKVSILWCSVCNSLKQDSTYRIDVAFWLGSYHDRMSHHDRMSQCFIWLAILLMKLALFQSSKDTPERNISRLCLAVQLKLRGWFQNAP